MKQHKVESTLAGMQSVVTNQVMEEAMEAKLQKLKNLAADLSSVLTDRTLQDCLQEGTTGYTKKKYTLSALIPMEMDNEGLEICKEEECSVVPLSIGSYTCNCGDFNPPVETPLTDTVLETARKYGASHYSLKLSSSMLWNGFDSEITEWNLEFSLNNDDTFNVSSFYYFKRALNGDPAQTVEASYDSDQIAYSECIE
jgi:hypothetical protein